MPGVPWWAWIAGLLVACALLLWLARGAFRRSVRREFITVLRETHPDIEILEEREDALIVHGDGIDRGQLNLARLYSAAAGLKPYTPEARRDLYRHHVGMLREHAEAASGRITLATHGDRIMPRLVPPEFLSGLPPGTDLPHTPLESLGLSVVYVIDAEHSVMYIARAHADQLGLDLTALHERALQNLARVFPESAVNGVREKQSLIVFKAGDSHDAARLLLVPQHLNDGEEIAAVIPDRDTLALAPIPKDGDWSGLRKMARMPAGEHVLLDRPLRVTSTGFRLA